MLFFIKHSKYCLSYWEICFTPLIELSHILAFKNSLVMLCTFWSEYQLHLAVLGWWTLEAVWCNLGELDIAIRSTYQWPWKKLLGILQGIARHGLEDLGLLNRRPANEK